MSTQPVTTPDTLAGLLALTLAEAMQRLHNSHRSSDQFSWRGCRVSSLCREAAALYERPETQLAIAVAAIERGSTP